MVTIDYHELRKLTDRLHQVNTTMRGLERLKEREHSVEKISILFSTKYLEHDVFSELDFSPDLLVQWALSQYWDLKEEREGLVLLINQLTQPEPERLIEPEPNLEEDVARAKHPRPCNGRSLLSLERYKPYS